MTNNEFIELPPTDMAESSFAAVRAVSVGARTFMSIASTVSLAGGVALGNYVLVPSIQASAHSTLEAAGAGATGGAALPAGTHLNSDGVLVDGNGVPVSSAQIGAMVPGSTDGAGSSFFAAASKAFRKNGSFGLAVTPEVAQLVNDLAAVVAAGDQSGGTSPSSSPSASAMADVLASAPADSGSSVSLAQAVLDSLPMIDMAVIDFHSNVSTATPGGGTTTDYLKNTVASAAGGSAAASAATTTHSTQVAAAGAAGGTNYGSTAGAAGSTGSAAGTTSHATQAAAAGGATSGSSTSTLASGSSGASKGQTSNATQVAAGSGTGSGVIVGASVQHEYESEDAGESEHQSSQSTPRPSSSAVSTESAKPLESARPSQAAKPQPSQSAATSGGSTQQSSEKAREAAKQAAEKAREAAKQAQEQSGESEDH